MPLRLVTKIGYGIGHVLNDLCASIWFTYALVFYNIIIGLENVDAGALLLFGQVADGAATILVGLMIDRWVLNERLFVAYGKKKMWHLIGTIGIIATMPFLFTPCSFCLTETATLIYYGALVTGNQICWALVQISHLSLASDLTLDTNERTQLLSLRSMFAVLSNLVLYSVAWGVLAIDTTNPHENLSSKNVEQFQIIVYSIVGFGGFISSLFHVLVFEKPQKASGGGRAIKKKFSEIFFRPLFYLIAAVYMCSRLFGNINQVLIPFYVREIMTIGAQSIAVIPLVMYISSFLTTLFIGFVNIRFGRLVAYLYGTVVGSSGISLVFFGSGEIYSTYVVYLTAVLLGSCQSTYLVTCLGVIADFIGDDIKNGALVFGTVSLADKLSSGLNIIVVQVLKTDYMPHYYQIAMSISSGLAVIIGTICIIIVYKFMKQNGGVRSLQNIVSPHSATSH